MERHELANRERRGDLLDPREVGGDVLRRHAGPMLRPDHEFDPDESWDLTLNAGSRFTVMTCGSRNWRVSWAFPPPPFGTTSESDSSRLRPVLARATAPTTRKRR